MVPPRHPSLRHRAIKAAKSALLFAAATGASFGADQTVDNLTVNQNATVAGILSARASGANGLAVQGSSTNSIGILVANSVASGRSYSIYSSGGGPSAVGTFGIFDNVTSLNRFVITAAGNVGIGTSTAADKVQVAGGGVWIDVNGTAQASRYYTRFLDAGVGKWGFANSFYPGLGQSAGALAIAAEEIAGQDLLISTRNAPDGTVMTMKTTGMVGIGTTLPTAGLHLRKEGTNYTDGAYFLVDSPNTTIGGGASIAGIKCARGNSPDYHLLRIKNGGGDNFAVRGDGNVGVGTAAPTAKLHVAGTAKVDQTLTVTGATTIGGTASVSGSLTAGQITTQSQLLTSVDASAITLGDITNADGLRNLVLRAQNQAIATLDANGVTIGSSTSAKNLRVSKVFAGEVEVKTQWWADHVFADDYRLRPLSEVEEHIAEHRHLPDMPAEAEVLDKGINVGDMAARQQRKIEELTLYAIESDKQNQRLRAEVAELRQAMGELRALIEAQKAAGGR